MFQLLRVNIEGIGFFIDLILFEQFYFICFILFLTALLRFYRLLDRVWIDLA